MVENPENPPAFPRPASVDTHGVHPEPVTANEGMSLRDYFAAVALPWALQNVDVSQPWKFTACITAYELADIMLKAREGGYGN